MSMINKPDINENYATKQRALGSIGVDRENDKWYVYVQHYTSVTAAIANGTVLTGRVGGNKDVVTDDISESKQNYVKGIGVAAITKNYYGWIQTWGEHSVIKTNGDDDIAAGDMLIADGTVDGTCNSVAAGTAPTHEIIGVATADDVNGDNTVAGFIRISRG